LPKLCFEAPKGALFVEETDLNPWHKAALGAMTFAEFDAFSRYQLDESDDNIALALHEHTRDFRMDFLTDDPVIAALKQVSFPIRRPLYSIPCLRDLASLPYDDRLALFSHRTPI